MKFNQFNWYVETRFVCLNGFENKEFSRPSTFAQFKRLHRRRLSATTYIESTQPNFVFVILDTGVLAISIYLFCAEMHSIQVCHASDSVSSHLWFGRKWPKLCGNLRHIKKIDFHYRPNEINILNEPLS